MINLASVRDNISSLSRYNHVGDSVSAAEAISNFTARPPAAYVSTSGERARGNEMSTGLRQRVIQTVSVLFVLAAERADNCLTDEVEQARGDLLQLLVGWTPEGAASPLEYVSYSMRAMVDGLIWGELLFAAPYYISQRP